MSRDELPYCGMCGMSHEGAGSACDRVVYLHDQGGIIDSIDGLPEGVRWAVLLWDHNDMIYPESVIDYSRWIAAQDWSDEDKRSTLHEVLDRVDEPHVQLTPVPCG